MASVSTHILALRPTAHRRGHQRISHTRTFRRHHIHCAVNPGSASNDESQVSNPFPAFSPTSLNAESTPDIMDAIDRALSGEESQAMLRDLAAAADKVARAKEMLADVERKQLELQSLEEELSRATAMEAEVQAADELVDQCALDVAVAEEEARLAAAALVEARAGSSLPASLSSSPSGLLSVDATSERAQSARASAVAMLAGCTAGLPFLAIDRLSALPPPEIQQALGDLPSWLPSLGFLSGALSLVATCAVFGVVYRYVVRADVANNIHLKSGVVLGFAVARGTAQLDAPFANDVSGATTSGLAAAFLNGVESLLVFALVATALEYCFQRSYVKRFPSSL